MRRSHATRTLACALSLVIALTIAGCSSGGSDSENDSAAPRPTPSAIAEPTQVPAPEGDATETSDPDEDAGDEFDPAGIEDLGARDGASGEAQQDDAGYWYYQVVSGDVASVICDRFERRWWQLETFDAELDFDCRSTIYPGQILIPTAYDERDAQEPPWVPIANPFES